MHSDHKIVIGEVGKDVPSSDLLHRRKSDLECWDKGEKPGHAHEEYVW
jgi:hypothetical protein